MNEASNDVPTPTREQRHTAAASLERAHAIAQAGDYDRAWRLLAWCCRTDPANLIYRQALRRVVLVLAFAPHRQRAPGRWRSILARWRLGVKLPRAVKRGDWLAVLDIGEQLLRFDPWDEET